MTPYEIYQKARSQRAECENWSKMIGKPSERATAYHLGKVTSSSGTFTIHYQPYDGATNYHDAPKPLVEVLQKVMTDNAKMLIDQCLVLLREREDVALINCKEFAQKILDEIESKSA